MSHLDIVRKLAVELDNGITSEAQVVYLLAGVRKLLEQQKTKKDYLKFYCDWALHSQLDRGMSQKILSLFDTVHVQLRDFIQVEDLPVQVSEEVEQISRMELFDKELNEFLGANGLPSLKSKDPQNWVRFLQLYGRVVEDSPLVVKRNKDSASIVKVTLNVQTAGRLIEGNEVFRVIWRVSDKNGRSGQFYVIFSFGAVRRPNLIQH